MSLPPVEIPLGAMRFNSDSQKLEYFNGQIWMQIHTFSPNLNGGTRGLIGGGSSIPASTGAVNIDFITIPTAGNATAFGDLTYGNAYRGGIASNTRGIFINSQNDQTTDYVTIATTGDAVSFGEILTDDLGGATFSNQIKGFRAGGADGGTHSNQIIGMTIATTSSFFDFGDMTPTGAGTYMNGCASPTRGMIFGGATPSTPTVIDNIQYLNMGSNGDSQDFGDLITARKYATCLSNSTRALCACGSDGSSSIKSIEYVTMSSTGNATNFGDATLTSSTNTSGSCSSPVRGIIAGAYPSSAHIEYVTIATQGDGVDFGDLNYHGYYNGGLSNGHGGLG